MIIEQLQEKAGFSPIECAVALDFDANLERRISASRGYERYRDSSNPILRDRD